MELPVVLTVVGLFEELLVVFVVELPVAAHYYHFSEELPVAVGAKPVLQDSHWQDDGIPHVSVVAADWVRYRYVDGRHYRVLPDLLFQAVAVAGGCTVGYAPGSVRAVGLHNPEACVGACRYPG